MTRPPTSPLLVSGPFGPFIMRGLHSRKLPREGRLGESGQNMVQLGVLVSGGGLTVAGQRLHAPCATFLEAGAGHRWSVDAGSEWGFLIFQLVHAKRVCNKGMGSWEHLDGMQPGSEAVFGVALPAVVPQALVADAIATVVGANAIYFKSAVLHAEADAALGRFLLRWAQWEAQQDPGSARPSAVADPFAHAEQRARERLETRVTVADMADSIGMSTAHFSRTYQASRGEAPVHFLERLRLTVAMQELRSGRSILHCAQRCGFRSPTAFSAFFKRHMSMTPTDWRQQDRRR